MGNKNTVTDSGNSCCLNPAGVTSIPRTERTESVITAGLTNQVKESIQTTMSLCLFCVVFHAMQYTDQVTRSYLAWKRQTSCSILEYPVIVSMKDAVFETPSQGKNTHLLCRTVTPQLFFSPQRSAVE